MMEPQKTYRVYRFDGALMSVTSDIIKVACDEEAIAAAKASGLESKCEIWDGNRLVAQLDGERQAG
ncbi:MAG TPA: hypothetical protein VH392_11650 [Sphingomicrobium sp.]|jgi:hypothetical protein